MGRITNTRRVAEFRYPPSTPAPPGGGEPSRVPGSGVRGRGSGWPPGAAGGHDGRQGLQAQSTAWGALSISAYAFCLPVTHPALKSGTGFLTGIRRGRAS